MENVARIIPHIFLPYKLPDGTNAENIVHEDTCLLQTFRKFLSEQHYEGCPFPNTIQAFNSWGQVQDSPNEALLAKSIADLKAGQSLPVYVRAQNAGLLITLSDAPCDGHPTESTVLSTFAASQKSVDVSSELGDLGGSYPSKSIHVPRSQLLTSITLARQIISLNQHLLSDALTKMTKSNNCYDDERDVADPMFVSKWLCGSLCNVDSCLCTTIPRIVKKVRDEVVFGGSGHCSLPFRRSGIWMTIKVILQILLVKELGPTIGQQMYKIILLKFMCTLCSLESIAADVGVQIMAKIARRLYKLYSLKDLKDPAYARLLDELYKPAEEAITRLRGRLDANWKSIVDEDLMKSRLLLSQNFDFYEDSKHTLVPLFNYTKFMIDCEAKGHQDEVERNTVGGNINACLNLTQLSEIPFSKLINFSSNDAQALQRLYIFEYCVLNNLSSSDPNDYAVVSETFISYLKASERAYDGDPVGISRSILVCLKVLKWVDHAVCESFNLMRKHDTGIPIKIIEHLMLPFSSDLKLAHELETYFTNRSRESILPSLLTPYDFPRMSNYYSVRHAASDYSMQRKRQEILNEGEIKAFEKMEEVRREKKEWELLRLKIQNMSCACKHTFNGRRFIHVKCERCLLESRADAMTVDIFQKPLPCKTELQNAIVFELLIPKPILYYREMFCAFLVHLGVLNSDDCCKSMWLDELHRYVSPQSENRTVSLCSRSEPQNRYYPRKLHPKEDINMFVVENTGNVLLCFDRKVIELLQDIPCKVLQRFVFKVEPGSPYCKLQWVLDDHDYVFSDNQILARQNECPSNLSLIEFKEFGSIRTGHRIQLRSLYRALKHETLSLNTESVLNLIYEVLWRAGPPSKEPNFPSYIRESHIDLLNNAFVKEFLSVLDILIDKFSENWDNHHNYAAVTGILLRIFSISDDYEILKECFAHLLKCRQILLNWCKSIENCLDAIQSESVADQNKTRKELVAVATLLACTYWSDVHCGMKECLVSKEVLSWLLSAKTIQEYSGGKDWLNSCSNTFRNQLRRFRECGLANFSLLHALISADSAILQTFTKNVWSGFSKCESQELVWKCHNGNTPWFLAEVLVGECSTVLQLEILEGHFLVNGSPEDFLPSDLKNHIDYNRIFGDFIIKVQPLTHSPWSAISKHPFRKAKMRFVKNVNSVHSDKISPYIISAVYNKGNELEYVPENAFNAQGRLCLQQFLIRKYTHWWSRSKRIIYFRSKQSHRVEYSLNMETNLIKEKVTGRLAIDNDSSTFRRIMEMFTRLEQEHFIEVLLQEKKSDGELHKLDVKLPRMRLHFTVTNEGSVLCASSLEYPGMKVAENQKCGTLIQLNNGLMLEPYEKEFSNDLMLIPHAKVQMESGRVLIDTAALRNPPYFAYEVDSTLLQLKSGQTKSASIYLAYLHAVTSYPLPDPFTKHTGTERAMQLLQSGHCWSCEPFDEESLKTLSLIMELSPKRKYNSKNQAMTTVSWPLANSMSCSDAFQIIVAKLIGDSQRLAVLFESTHDVKQNVTSKLCEKAYWRHFMCTTKHAHISHNFLKMQSPSVRENTKFECSFADHSMNAVLKLASLVDQWDIVACSAEHLHGFLVNGRSHLRGHSDPFPVHESIVEWDNLEFWDSWLMLYTLAKTVKQKNLMAEWKIILTSYAFKGISEEQLLLLHSIAVYPEMFDDPPNYEGYEQPGETTFNRSEIRSRIGSCVLVSYDLFLTQQIQAGLVLKDDDYCKMEKLYENRLRSEIDGLTDKLANVHWPFRSCGSIVDGYSGNTSFLDLKEIIKSVDIQLNKWFNNYELKQFIKRVEEKVVELGKFKQVIKLDVTQVGKELSPDMPIIDFTRKIIEFSIHEVEVNVHYPDDFEAAKTAFQKGIIEESEGHSIYLDILSNYEDFIEENAMNKIHHDILSDPNKKTCKIWEQLTACLRVESTSLNSDLHHSKLTGKRTSASSHDSNCSYKMKRLYEFYDKMQMRYWDLVEAMLMTDPLVSLLIAAKIYQRLTPLTILPLIAQKEGTPSSFQSNLRDVLGAFGVAVTCKKHALRCLKYMKSNSQFELQRELSSPPHQNWSPAERPEWLLFEIEMDLVVRPIQMQVAEQMENPENDINAVTQLNMGEGKTAVITPLLILSLTNKKQLCRVTVLRSLFNTNKQALGFSLGGMLLDRRIYIFPCRRDILMSKDVLGKMLSIYKECKAKGGVNLTTPAYRLSFHLKTYEQCQAGQCQVAASLFLEIQDWLRRNARDVLDESDEILHAKYQLVYALGMQMPIVGGSERWGFLQRLLGHIPEVVKILDETEGTGFVEIFQQKDGSKRGAFPCCRLLKINIYEKFCEMLAVRILNGTEFPNLQIQEKALLRTFLTKQAIDTSLTQQVFELFSSNSYNAFHEKALILRGLMACGVLFASLNKRWRVNYGVSPNGRSLLAVPFRAKDVAADRTEFGHVDVALVLTHLSYYYSGLNESQVRDCLYHVMKGPNPEMEYNGWISTMENPDPSIPSMRGINPENPLLRNEVLVPALKKNKAVIDYWLGNIVLPVQIKQFPAKMISTAWDLASDQGQKATTGFSGTNDTQILLPLTIAQKDLPELRLTNFEVFQNLLSEENSHYESLPGGAMSVNILKKLVKNDIPVLLDVGALMLDLNNEDVARKWLSLTNKKSKNAAVYFSKEDRLMVMDRSSLGSVPFEISPFRSMLDQCVIYLDDVHTRGTDLKFPSGMRGCITLGKGVTKDKLVQGCMRMRKLGKGHTVCFWASNEVNNEIIAMVGPDVRISSAEVLKWALNNSRNSIRDEFVFWVVAACNYISKTTAQKHYDHSTTKMDSDRAILAEQVSVGEVIDLKEMYGNPCSNASFPTIAAQLLQKCCPDGGDADVSLLTYKQRVVDHCQKYVSDLEKRVHLLDEEQERELQQEQEEERELERPGAAKPCTPVLHEAMVEFLKTKYKIMDMENMPFWAQHLPKGLHCTTLDEHNESAAWGKYIFVTADFLRTVEGLGLKDSYLRTVNWIVAFMVNNSLCWLLVSPFEVNHLIPMFRSKQMKASLHMYAARLSSTQSTLLDLDNLVLPVGVTQSLTSTPGFYDLNASLCIFAGCIYFQNQTEFESYCALTGYVPNPRSAEEEQALAKMVIDNTGFLLPSGRQRLRPKCIFQRNPERLIVGVINCRYNYFSRLCHVARLLLECQKPNFEET